MQRLHKKCLTNFPTLITLSFFGGGIAEGKTPIKIAALKFGTVNWTLETIKKMA